MSPIRIGRYALYEALAAGGMATVHLGRLVGPIGFSRTVAIKRLHEQFASDPEFVPGFLDEARLAARIRHPNVVPTLDVVADEGQLFLVMEFVQGESLARLLKVSSERRVKVPPRVAVGVMIGALNGLHAAHEARNEKGEPLDIVHRDVSPQNILVGADGVPRVLDFGVAKAAGRLQTTRSGQLKGKTAYMAPEQLRSETVDRKTDIFAASIVLWETLTARRLFAGENESAVLTAVLFGTIDPPSKYAPDVSPALDAIVLRGLERERDKRWSTARELANALEDAIAPATARQIAEWVDGLAHDAIAARAARVAEIESATESDAAQTTDVLATLRATSSGSVAVAAGITGPDMATVSHSTVSVRTALPTKRRWLVPILALVIGGVLTAGVFVYANRTSATPAASIGIASVSATISVTATAPAPTPATASLTVTASASAPPSAKPAVKKPAVDCSNPYTRDELGRKIYKRECLE